MFCYLNVKKPYDYIVYYSSYILPTIGAADSSLFKDAMNSGNVGM